VPCDTHRHWQEGFEAGRKAERERITQIIAETELPIGTTQGSIQEACRRTILEVIKADVL